MHWDAVLYHPSFGWICHAPRQDPSHSDDDVTQYMQHGLLQPMAFSLSSVTVYLHLSILLLSGLLLSELATHGQSIPLADPHEAWLSSTDLASSALSQSVPRAKSHLVIPTLSPLGLLHCPLIVLPNLHLLVLITPDQVPGASPSH